MPGLGVIGWKMEPLLTRKHGRSILYEQFLKNVVERNYQDYILQYPQTSHIAYRWFNHKEIQADLIFLDGDHTEPFISADIKEYYQLLKPSGILSGHDIQWPTVRKALEKFCLDNGKRYKEVNNLWSLNQDRLRVT